MNKFNVGDKVKNIHTGDVYTIRKVVKAAYYCYYFNEIEGYYTDIDLAPMS